MNWQWVQEHPAEFAWLVLGIVSALVLALRPALPRLEAWAKKSRNTVDDRIVWVLGHIVGLLVILVEVARGFVPTAFGRRTDKGER